MRFGHALALGSLVSAAVEIVIYITLVVGGAERHDDIFLGLTVANIFTCVIGFLVAMWSET